jgi:hypothetical protein
MNVELHRGSTMNGFLMMILIITVSTLTLAQTAQLTENKAMDRVKHLKDFQVIEFRRYTVKEGERATGLFDNRLTYSFPINQISQ